MYLCIYVPYHSVCNNSAYSTIVGQGINLLNFNLALKSSGPK